MALKGFDATTALGAGAGVSAPRSNKLPHLDRAIQGARHKVSAIWSKCDRIDRVLVAVRAFQALDEISVGGIPHADTLVERASSDVLGVRGNGDGGHAVLDAKRQNVLAGLNIPESHSTVTTARGDGSPITSKVERVDVLLVTSEAVPDRPVGDIPDLALSACFKNHTMRLL